MACACGCYNTHSDWLILVKTRNTRGSIKGLLKQSKKQTNEQTNKQKNAHSSRHRPDKIYTVWSPHQYSSLLYLIISYCLPQPKQ